VSGRCERAHVNFFGWLTQEEASLISARMYGNVIDELEVQGTHLDVCARCLTGSVDEFSLRLRKLLSQRGT
jgi:hypothetical protein